MSDLIQELRDIEDDKYEGWGSPALCGRAADEIERLRAERSSILGNPHLNGQAAEQLPQSWREKLGIY